MDNISEIIKNVIGKMADKSPDTLYQVEQVWNENIDDKTKEHTFIVGIKDNKLSIIVDSPAWAYQMKIKKSSILKKIQIKFPEIKDIIYRVGNV